MKVVIPSVNSDGSRVIFKPGVGEGGVLEKYKARDHADIIVLHNKSPQWNEDTKSYVLNFHNRVKQASVKNFQLVYEADGNSFTALHLIKI
jgi:tubby and related proteins